MVAPATEKLRSDDVLVAGTASTCLAHLLSLGQALDLPCLQPKGDEAQTTWQAR